MLNYIAVIDHEDGVYGVSFPDFPGCVTAGDSIEEVKEKAQEALELHIEGMQEDGEALPAPSGAKAVQDPDVIEYFVVSVPEPKAAPVSICLSIDPGLLSDVDRSYKELGYTTRAAFINSAVRQALSGSK